MTQSSTRRFQLSWPRSAACVSWSSGRSSSDLGHRASEDGIEERAHSQQESLRRRVVTADGAGERFAAARADGGHDHELGVGRLTEPGNDPERCPAPHRIGTEKNERLQNRVHRRLECERRGVDGPEDAVAERGVVSDQLLELSDGQVGMLERTQELQMRELPGCAGGSAGKQGPAEEEPLNVREPVLEGLLEPVERLDVLGHERRPTGCETRDDARAGFGWRAARRVNLEEIGERHQIGGSLVQHEVIERDRVACLPKLVARCEDLAIRLDLATELHHDPFLRQRGRHAVEQCGAVDLNERATSPGHRFETHPEQVIGQCAADAGIRRLPGARRLRQTAAQRVPEDAAIPVLDGLPGQEDLRKPGVIADGPVHSGPTPAPRAGPWCYGGNRQGRPKP